MITSAPTTTTTTPTTTPILKPPSTSPFSTTPLPPPKDPSNSNDLITEMRSRLQKDVIEPSNLSKSDSEEAIQFCDDACLRRYLRSRNWDLEKALVKLKETVVWRAEYRPHEIKPEDIAHEAMGGNNYVNGFDKHGRPIIYLKKRGKVGDPVNNVRLLVLTLEQAIRMMPKDGSVEKVCLILDMTEYTRANSPPMAITKLTLNILSNHYPEDPVTQAKIKFIKCPRPTPQPQTRIEIEDDDGTRSLSSQVTNTTTATKSDSTSGLLQFIDAEMLERMYGGNLDFVYDHEVYWKVVEAQEEEGK
ncbi:hypothetical protein HDU76_009021 [Blyttiomyces sp. JEL0837]|nr:hypothetical protein HDU76_009021 [Blyttiomyces sp. JEL0837]